MGWERGWAGRGWAGRGDGRQIFNNLVVAR